jgi:hypothetical protein
MLTSFVSYPILLNEIPVFYLLFFLISSNLQMFDISVRLRVYYFMPECHILVRVSAIPIVSIMLAGG